MMKSARFFNIVFLLFSTSVKSQEIPLITSAIDVPLNQFVNVPGEPGDYKRTFAWPSLTNRTVELTFSENPPYVSTPSFISMIPDGSRIVGGNFSFFAANAEQLSVSITYTVPTTQPNGRPNDMRSSLYCFNDSGTGARTVFNGQTVLLGSFLGGNRRVTCLGQNNLYSFVQVNKVTMTPSMMRPDLIAGSIDIPNSKFDPKDGLPIINVGKPVTINVPVSLSAYELLTASELALSVPVTLSLGSQVMTKNLSLADLRNSGSSIIIPFELIPVKEDAGDRRITVSVNGAHLFNEETYDNNEAFQDVHVVDGLTLQVSALSLGGADYCMFSVTGQLDPRFCQSGKIKDGDVLKVPFGAVLKLALMNDENENIPASFQLVEESLSLDGAIEPNSLFSNQLAVFFDPEFTKSSQSLITVHLGAQKVQVTPLDDSITPFTVVLNSVSSETIGDSNNTYDEIIIKRAHQVGIPPQYIKGQVEQESGGRFNPDAYRYEPITNDMKLIQPKISNSAAGYAFKGKTDSKWYGKYLFRPKDRLSTDLDLIGLRSLYKVQIGTSTPESVPIDYETRVKKNSYTPLYILDLLDFNTKANWNKAKTYNYYYARSDDKIAQTIISSSYGLMQILYTTAIQMGFVTSGVGKDPALLLDPETNITLATKYLVNCIKKVNEFQESGPNPQMSINFLNLYIQLGFAGYNGGLDKTDASAPNYNFKYRSEVLSNSKKYPILFKNEIL